MNRAATSLVLVAIGGIALRIGATDEYARYINDWMRWPLVASGLLLLGLAVALAVGRTHEDEHRGERIGWLLVLPIVVGLVVQPPALGSYVAERRANQVDAAAIAGSAGALDPAGENAIPVSEFVARAALDGGASLTGATVRLTGFVSTDDSGGWYVSRLTIACCAADAVAFRVLVDGVEAPPKEQWVDVVGTWVDGTGTDAGETPAIAAGEVEYVDEPTRPYE